MHLPGFWLCRADVLEAMSAASGTITAAQQAEFDARQVEASTAPRAYDGVARIAISGVLTDKPNFFAMLFGGGNTTYESIRSAIAEADADPAVKEIELQIDSPGGEVRGLFETVDAIAGASKPTRARASMATSAAYALAAATGRIEATSRASEFGSVGIVQTFFKNANVINVTSSDAPDKRPDPTTAEGKQTIQRTLDAMHTLFVEAIASGRTAAGSPTTAQQVNANFGRGAVLLAGEAERRGMIDSLAATQPAAGKRAERDSAMNIQDLKAQHPAVYAAVLEEGKVLGAKEERDRVCAHLELGEACGDLKIALAAVRAGEGMTQTNQAKYLAAGMNRRDIAAKQADSDAAATAVAGAAGATEAKDLGDSIADIMAASRGKAV